MQIAREDWPELVTPPPWVVAASASPNAGVQTEPSHFFKSDATGLRIHYRTCAPPSSACQHAVILFHGLNDHCNKLQYTTLMSNLASALNANVFAADMIGHGLSEASAPKLISNWKSLVDDATQFIYRVVPSEKSATFQFVSHSTGGAICLHLLAAMAPEEKVRFRGCYMLAPLVLAPPVPAPTKFVLSALLALAPCIFTTTTALTPPRKTDSEPWVVFPSPSVHQNEAVKDPLQWQGGVPLRTGKTMIDFATATAKLVETHIFDVNIKVVHGTTDGLVSIEGSRRLSKQPHAEIWELEGEKHLPLVGNHGEAVSADIVEWLRKVSQR